MSAFLCSATHTLAVALAFNRADPSRPVRETALALRRLNNAALAARYGTKPQRLYASSSAIEAATRWVDAATPADCHALALGLRYQCDEGDCESHPDWALLVALCDALAARANGLRSDVWSI